MKDENRNENKLPPNPPELNSAEFRMVRSRMAQLNEDRSAIPPPEPKKQNRLLRFIKKNKAVSAVIAILILSAVTSAVLLGIFLGDKAARNSKKDYVFTFGKEEVKYEYEKIVIDGILYVDMNRLAEYAEIPVSGSEESMKYFLSDTMYLKFTDESDYAIINATKVLIPAPAIVENSTCLVPYSVVSKAISDGITFKINDRKHTVSITRNTYEIDEREYFEDIVFSPDDFTEAGALKGTAGVKFEYNKDVTAVMNFIDPQDDAPYLLLVNKKNPLGSVYTPEPLSQINVKYTADGAYYLDPAATAALEAMMEAMYADYPLCGTFVTSAYRSYGYQVSLFEKYVSEYTARGYSREEAENEVLKTSARPGTSEHQSGLCVDFLTRSMRNGLNNSEFTRTDAFRWLSENAYKYGFILRYPEDKTDITEYDYESWHYRFVGRDAATAIYFSGICLEEYLEYV